MIEPTPVLIIISDEIDGFICGGPYFAYSFYRLRWIAGEIIEVLEILIKDMLRNHVLIMWQLGYVFMLM